MLSKGTVASSFPHQFRRTIELIEHYQFFITSSTILTYIYNIIIYIIYIIYICSNIFQLVPCLFLEIQHVHVVPGVRSVSWGSLGLSRWSSHGILQARENIPRAVGVRWFNMFNYHTMCTLKHLKTRYLEAFGCIWHRPHAKNWGFTIPASWIWKRQFKSGSVLVAQRIWLLNTSKRHLWQGW